jgi:predicted Zn-dependent protease with MMP-like domain
MSDADAATAWRDAPAPSLDDIAALAAAAFADLPEKFRRLAGDVIFRVDDFPSDEVLEDLGIEDPFELTGLYQGVDLGRRSVLGPAPEPARVFLYRRPILDEWTDRGDVGLAELVAHVLTHEIGHHLGLSDDDIDAIEAAAD